MTHDEIPGDRPRDPGPATELRLKKGAAARGDDLCPACGGIIEKGVVICLRCGLDLRTGKQFQTKNSATLNVRARRMSRRMAALFASLLILLLRVAVVAVVVYAANLGYRALTSQDASIVTPREKGHQVACAACAGTGKIKCKVCGGFGSTEVVIAVPCDQCKGTGSYAWHLGKSKVACPFCKGSGTREQRVRKTCAACGGTGSAVCSRCGGSGVLGGGGISHGTNDEGIVAKFWKNLTE